MNNTTPQALADLLMAKTPEAIAEKDGRFTLFAKAMQRNFPQLKLCVDYSIGYENGSPIVKRWPTTVPKPDAAAIASMLQEQIAIDASNDLNSSKADDLNQSLSAFWNSLDETQKAGLSMDGLFPAIRALRDSGDTGALVALLRTRINAELLITLTESQAALKANVVTCLAAMP